MDRRGPVGPVAEVGGGPAVLARGLWKSYGSFQAVRGVDVEIAAEQCFGFLGPNGAGKTTTMRMLSCLSRRDAGELSVLGLEPDLSPRELKRQIGVVPQEVNLDLELSVRENLLVYARYFDIPRPRAAARSDELLDLVSLSDRAGDPVDSLSGGMKRRLQIARALVNSPRMILLDEPTTGLDPQARHLLWERLRQLKRGGVTIVLTTHYMEEAAQLCDRLVIMDAGRVVAEGAPAQLVQREVGRDAVELRLAPAAMPALLDFLDGAARAHQSAGDLLLVFADDGESLRARARQSGVAHEVQAVRRASLEDVFLALTGRELTPRKSSLVGSPGPGITDDFRG